RIFGASRAIAAEVFETMAEIDIVTAKTALSKNRGDRSGHFARTLRRRIDHHAREARRQRQSAQFATFVGDAAVIVDGPDLAEQGPGLIHRGLRWRIEECELACIGRPPLGEIERERRQIGGQYFWPRIGLKRSGLRLVPEPVTDAWLGTAGAATPLIGGRARDAHG